MSCNLQNRGRRLVSVIACLLAAALLVGPISCKSKRTKKCEEGYEKIVTKGEKVSKKDLNHYVGACTGSCQSAKEKDACEKLKAINEKIYGKK